MRKYNGKMDFVVKIILAGTVLFAVLDLLHIYEWFGVVFYQVAFRALFTGLILGMVFIMIPPTKKGATDKLPWYDVVLSVIAFLGGLYPFIFYKQISLRAAYATGYELILGFSMILLIAEAIRRTTGWVLVIILGVFVVYTPYCNYFPGFLEGVGYSLPRAIGHLYLFDDGMFGLVMGVISTIALVFILFAQFLFSGGAGKFLTDLAYSIFGAYSGGPAKGAVIASAAFGTISGSPVGDAVTTGTFTIPLMIKAGYKPYYAAAVEAVSSTGAALMPPVMGMVAFIMAEFLNVSYTSVLKAALWPAVLYYVAVFVQVHYQARKLNLVGLPKNELPKLRATLLEGWIFILPLITLLYALIIAKQVEVFAAFYAIAIAILVSLFKKESRLGPKKIFESLEQTGRKMLNIVPVCAAAGIIIGSVGLTGFGVHLSSILIDISGGSAPVLLILAAIASVVMSMGMPWTGCYILLAILIAPALTSLGIDPMAAHLFLLFMGLISFITPPVCIVVYSVCTLSQSSIWSTGFQAVRLGIIAYIVPFIFVINPCLILKGAPLDILLSMLTSLIGVFALGSGLEGYFLHRATWLERVLWLGGGLCLIIPGINTDSIGAILIIAGVVCHVGIKRLYGKVFAENA